MKFITKGDCLIAAIVIIAAAISYITFAQFVSSELPDRIEIFVDGSSYAAYNLNEITSEKLVEINTKFGSNILKITPDGAKMISASCPDKLDVRCGKITKPGHVIICVPNRVLVRLTGNTELKVDKVTY